MTTILKRGDLEHLFLTYAEGLNTVLKTQACQTQTCQTFSLEHIFHLEHVSQIQTEDE